MEEMAEKICMSMLARYKKPGGFLQLLSLIESFGSQKREKFMEMIQAEDVVWAEALHKKMLSIERLFTWPEQTITEIFRVLPTKNLACAMKGISKENADKIMKYLSHAEKRKLDDEMGALAAKPEDIFASFVRVIEVTRKMIREGDIRLDKIDADMMIPENYEESLNGKAVGSVHTHGHAPAQVHVASHADVVPDNKGSQDVMNLHRMVAALNKDNAALKEEVRVLREKLEQIRRIA
jgi:hypothetical protein